MKKESSPLAPSPESDRPAHPRFAINDAIHQPVRLSILGIVAHAERVDFAFLRDQLQVKDANLSQHLTALETLGYIAIEKTFEGKRARTWVSLTPHGRAAFTEYLGVLQQLLAEPLDLPQTPDVESSLEKSDPLKGGQA